MSATRASGIVWEPFLHFLLLGLLIFCGYAWIEEDEPEDQIVVTRGQQLNLIETFERTWRRPPSPAELSGLVSDYVRQELAYREAASMGLDRNDVVIRRRLRQKLELLTEDVVSLAPPTEEELEAYFEENAERFRIDARFSFEHVYFSTDRGARDAEADARELLVPLRSGNLSVDDDVLGDPIALPARIEDAAATEISSLFGADFPAQLARLVPGVWSGPLRSAFGLHLVRVTELSQSRIPELDQVAREATIELLARRRAQAIDALYRNLARDYTIRVEPLEAAVDGPKLSASDRGAVR